MYTVGKSTSFVNCLHFCNGCSYTAPLNVTYLPAPACSGSPVRLPQLNGEVDIHNQITVELYLKIMVRRTTFGQLK